MKNNKSSQKPIRRLVRHYNMAFLTLCFYMIDMEPEKSKAATNFRNAYLDESSRVRKIVEFVMERIRNSEDNLDV